MNVPPFLLGAALIFWGWQSGFMIVGAVMGFVLEAASFLKIRWDISNDDFSRIWTFCTVLFLATGAYAFTAGNGPAGIGSLFANGAAPGAVGIITTKTAVLMLRWSPMSLYLFIAAQAFSNREGIPLETISLILRRRWKKALKAGMPAPASHTVNISYPYLMVCLFAASSHPIAANNNYFWGLCALVAWALWARRSRRFGVAVWVGTLAVAIGLAFAGQRGLVQLKQIVAQYNPEWLGGMAHEGFDPLESRTEIGSVGRIKTSSQIVIRLETPDGHSPPPYLREAGYRTYKLGVWYAGSSKDDFGSVPEEPLNSGQWPLIPGRTNNPGTLGIACYLYGGKGLLPLPTASGRLEQLPAYVIQKNGVGSVRAEGPGLVIFNARYGSGAVIDLPPDASEDLAVPDREKPALDEIISKLHLVGQSHEKAQGAISQYFATSFNYSLYQKEPRNRDTNSTALSRFLQNTHAGHCEYFATATVLLLRELGIPARYTVGYSVHETSGSKYIVRQNDAHAWCRVWSARKNLWEDFDTTPGTWLEKERQQRSAFQFISDAWSRVTFEFSRFRYGQANFRQYILWALVPVLALLLYQIIFRSGRRRARQNAKAGVADIFRPGSDSEFYQLEKALTRRGLARRSSEPPSDWLRRIANDPGFRELKDSIQLLLRLHYRYRFDPLGLAASDRALLRREVESCLARLPGT